MKNAIYEHRGVVIGLDVYPQLYNLTKTHKVNFHKVKGHSDNVYNNRCDELARNAIKEL